MHAFFYFFSFSFLIGNSLFAEEAAKPLQEMTFDHSGRLQIGEKMLDYRGQAGTLILKEENGKERGSIFYLAYFLKGVPTQDRPITFCFNGGPGAGSAWLSLGMAGPKTVFAEDLQFKEPPYELQDNPSSLLDLTDLVFIDPLGAGLSCPAAGQDLKKIYSVDEDAEIMAECVKQFTSKFKRWDSPKYLLGESYGGLRAVLMAYRLHDVDAFYLNGLILVAPALDMQTIIYNEGNDLPYLLAVPTLAQAAGFYGKAASGITDEKLQGFINGPYFKALFAGTSLGKEEKEKTAEELSKLIGLSKEFILENDLRIQPWKFRKQLLKEEQKCVGRFDARYSGIALSSLDSHGEYDPALDAVFGAVTAAMNQYLVKEFKWPELKDYKPLVSIPTWDWGKGNHYANALAELRRLMAQNPKIKVFVAMGEYDLAIPSDSIEFALRHAMIADAAQARLIVKKYPAGHMFYFNRDKLLDFKYDVNVLYNKN